MQNFKEDTMAISFILFRLYIKGLEGSFNTLSDRLVITALPFVSKSIYSIFLHLANMFDSCYLFMIQPTSERI